MTDETIFAAALEKTTPPERAAYLETACADNAEQRARIERLLAAHDRASGFLERPAVAGADSGAVTSALGEELHLERAADEINLTFLEPSTKPDSLGRLGHYEILEVLGRGGFGIVLRAFDETLHRVVAVKVLSPEMAVLSPARKRFLREARASAPIRHENVVQVYAIEESPLPYIVMEFVPGRTLQDFLDGTGPLEVPDVVRIGVQIARGLAAAHELGLIHRDIKPANILLEGGIDRRVKITDFGLARAADDASITTSGVIAGTPLYMAPEQARGDKLDHRADLFSFGSVLYTMCAGHPAFRASSTLAVMKRVCDETPRPIQEIIPETPHWLCDIISKLHAKNPDDRFQSAKEVADLLAKYAVSPPPPEVKAKPKAVRAAGESKRSRKPLLVATLLCLAIAGGITAALLTTGDKWTDPIAKKEAEPPKKNETPMPVAVDPDRKAAEWVLSVGGTVQVNDQYRGIKTVTELPKEPIRLTRIDLPDNPEIRSAELTKFKECKHLTGFSLAGEWVTDDALAFFKDCENLTQLTLYPTNVSDAGLAFFKDCNNLTDLFLGSEGVTDAGLAHFKDCKNLTALRLHGTRTSDAGLAHFKDCSALKSLALAGVRVSDAGLAHLKHWNGLTTLYLENIQITDAGLVHIGACKNLARCRLRGVSVSDMGLEHLKECKNLTYLDIPKTKVTAAGVAELAKALPQCRIEWDGGNIEPKAAVVPPIPEQPTDVMKFFVGSWRMEAWIEEPKLPTGLVARATGLQTFELIVGGKFLRGFDTEDKAQVEMLTVLTWDAEEQVFHGWFFNSAGEISSRMSSRSTGTWDAGKHLLAWKGMNGDAGVTYDFQIVDGKTIKTQLVQRDRDNKVVHVVRQTMTRLDAPPNIQRMPVNPKRSAELKLLDRVTGEWRNTVTMKSAVMPNQPQNHSLLLRGEHILGGRMVEVREIDEANGNENHWLIGYDPTTKKYPFWHFHSNFDSGYAEGTWDEAKTTMHWKAKDMTFDGRWIFHGENKREVPFVVKDRNGNIMLEGDGVTRRILTTPFTLVPRAGQAAQAFKTLKEAITAAEANDIIEIHGDGPYTSDLLRIRKPLRIRAAEHSRPVIVFKHAPMEKFWPGVVEVHSPLTVEGVEFRYARPAEGGLAQLFLVTSDLRMTHCRIVVQGESDGLFLNYGLAELHCCELLSDQWANLRWNLDGPAKLVLSQSLLIAPGTLTLHAYAKREKIHDLEVRITNSTLIANHLVGWLLDQSQPAPKDDRKAISFEVTGSVLSLTQKEAAMLLLNGNVDGEYKDAASATALVQKNIRWTEGHNLYPDQPLIGLVDRNRGQLLAGGSLCPTMDEWRKFWGIALSKTTQGTPKFQGGYLRGKLEKSIHGITAADFKLADGSPGKGAAVGGLDLGANVELVGPGDAYGKWKATPAYQEWLKK